MDKPVPMSLQQKGRLGIVKVRESEMQKGRF